MKVDFFVVGAARCGTTSLYQYLKQHPEVFLPLVKEPNFFSEVTSKNKDDYKPPKEGTSYHAKIISSGEVYDQLYAEAKADQIRGDVSPSYFYDLNAAQRIKAHNPEARIIITLRNPIARAFSHYVMNYGIGYETASSFSQAIQKKTESHWGGGNLYLELSHYTEAVKTYLEVFGESQVKILVFEDWISDKEATMKSLFNFLGVRTDFKIDLSQTHNEKVSYKNIGFLNFLRMRYVKEGIRFILPSKTIDTLKEKMFGQEQLDLTLDVKVAEELKTHFKADVFSLEALLRVPLTEKWNMM